MYTSRRKIQKDQGVEPSELRTWLHRLNIQCFIGVYIQCISFKLMWFLQSFFDLENTNLELKSDLKDIYINSAAQIDVSGNRKVVVIYVPYRLQKAFRKIHLRLVGELEKKFSGKHVVLIAARRILHPPKKGSAVVRPRTRTLTAVHEAMLEDIVYPAEIVGKHVRYRADGSKIIKASKHF
ncbi:40S ribosomal protein S7 [Vitis vinifera]|uniref:40S ribosomal protein S7 n=1 Tax=Vitis vinifera TaxID=29760 RepID=A0A438JY49_VITVI|nr:40S ribosomal protein S7 [Vitis vinifera]